MLVALIVRLFANSEEILYTYLKKRKDTRYKRSSKFY